MTVAHQTAAHQSNFIPVDTCDKWHGDRVRSGPNQKNQASQTMEGWGEGKITLISSSYVPPISGVDF